MDRVACFRSLCAVPVVWCHGLPMSFASMPVWSMDCVVSFVLEASMVLEMLSLSFGRKRCVGRCGIVYSFCLVRWHAAALQRNLPQVLGTRLPFGGCTPQSTLGYRPCHRRLARSHTECHSTGKRGSNSLMLKAPRKFRLENPSCRVPGLPDLQKNQGHGLGLFNLRA